VKRLLAALAGILGIAWLRRRRHEPEQAPDPADELRAKLAETRVADPEPEPEPEEPADVAARRQDVHDRARAAIDELSAGE
jgi:DNA-directed RNA polymerase specialized sigma24 family protein